MKKYLQKQQRLFNAALEDGDASLIKERGLDLLETMAQQPKLSADEESYRDILVAMISVVTVIDGDPKLLQGLSKTDRLMVMSQLGMEVIKRRKQQR